MMQAKLKWFYFICYIHLIAYIVGFGFYGILFLTHGAVKSGAATLGLAGFVLWTRNRLLHFRRSGIYCYLAFLLIVLAIAILDGAQIAAIILDCALIPIQSIYFYRRRSLFH